MDCEDIHEDDCNCAVCDTLVMGPATPPTKAAPGTTGRCVFCRTVKDVEEITVLGMNVCGDCTRSL